MNEYKEGLKKYDSARKVIIIDKERNLYQRPGSDKVIGWLDLTPEEQEEVLRVTGQPKATEAEDKNKNGSTLNEREEFFYDK